MTKFNFCESISLNDKNHQEEKEKSRLEYFDGIRGSLALSVLFRHGFLYYGLSKDFPFFWQLGLYYGVTGFFILSSFLLTHGLVKELYKCSTFKSVQLIVLKYFIRRFFRIYLPFFLVCSLIKGVSSRFIGMYAKYTKSWLSMVTLQSTGFTHLWTIAPEIKYYFFIPIFAIATVQFKKYKLVWLISTIVSCILIEYFNLFMQTAKDFELPLGHVLSTRFSVFYLGSILALIYDNICQRKKLMDFLNRSKLVSGVIALVLFVKILKYGSISYNPKLNEYEHFFIAGLHLAAIYLFMLIGEYNFFTDIFRNSFLKMLGKFSFGIYLLHPMCLIEVAKYLGPYLKYRHELLIYALVVSVFTGALFYYLIERPLIIFANNLCQKLTESKYFNKSLEI